MSENFVLTERCLSCGAWAHLMTDPDDGTTPQLDQWGYPQYYCSRCGAITAVGQKLVPAPPQSVLEDAARQMLNQQPDMSAIDLASRLRIKPRDENSDRSS